MYNQESIYKKNLKHSLHFFGSDMSSRSHNVYSFDPKLSEASSHGVFEGCLPGLACRKGSVNGTILYEPGPESLERKGNRR